MSPAGLNRGLLTRDHNATSYSTETRLLYYLRQTFLRRDHNATSYSTETHPAEQEAAL